MTYKLESVTYVLSWKAWRKSGENSLEVGSRTRGTLTIK